MAKPNNQRQREFRDRLARADAVIALADPRFAASKKFPEGLLETSAADWSPRQLREAIEFMRVEIIADKAVLRFLLTIQRHQRNNAGGKIIKFPAGPA